MRFFLSTTWYWLYMKNIYKIQWCLIFNIIGESEKPKEKSSKNKIIILMKTKNVVLIIIATILILGGFSITRKYNSAVNMQEGVKSAWSQVENQYQRRADLIPNLVSVVQGYAKHENATLTAVIEARAKATSITIDPTKATPAQLKAYSNAQGDLSQSLGKLMMLTEAYPNLKANESFRDLQAQLEGTENRISTERKRFNDQVKEYNAYIRRFPMNMFTGMFGFEKWNYFEADASAQKVPQVKF